MPARESHPPPHDKPRPLQRRRSLAAQRSRNRRFHARDDRLVRSDVWWRAWEDVRAHGGSAGVDAVGREGVERGGVQGFLDELAADLQARRYRPKPGLRVDIPKPDGRQRPLGIPTVCDRVVQAACKRVVEPVFETSVRDSSYGFRPQRDAGHAVRAVKAALVGGWWVLEADMQDCFDPIDHGRPLRLVQRRRRDRRVADTHPPVADRWGCRGWQVAGHPNRHAAGGSAQSPARQHRSARAGSWVGGTAGGGGSALSLRRRWCATSTKTAERAAGVRHGRTDEGRPLGTGLQAQVPNHLRLLWSKAMVGSAGGKGLERTRSGDRPEEARKGTTDDVSKA